MDLLSKAIIAAVVIVVIIFAAYFAINHVSFGQQVTESQATSLVLHDLQNSDPQAVINITNVTPSTYGGSWYIVASVVTNATSPCPSYYIESFDYPKFGFTSTPVNTYTVNCHVYGTNSSIGSYPAAITDSYLKNLSVVTYFVDKYGYSNVVVHATYYNTTSYYGKNYTRGTWLVNYTTPNSNQSVSVLLSQANASVLSTSGVV